MMMLRAAAVGVAQAVTAVTVIVMKVTRKISKKVFM
jgi:hypothetical protein